MRHVLSTEKAGVLDVTCLLLIALRLQARGGRECAEMHVSAALEDKQRLTCEAIDTIPAADVANATTAACARS